jgi:UDP-N-acetylglucosamine 3-dehydrogenase
MMRSITFVKRLFRSFLGGAIESKMKQAAEEEVERPVKLAVFGAGYWGTKLCREYHAIENTTREVELCYVVDSSELALENVRKELETSSLSSSAKKTKYISDYRQVLKDQEIEAVHVALPNQFHYEVAREALEVGKNVLIEKPISTTSREAFKLARLSEEKGLVLQVGHIFRFNNAIRTVKEVLRSGKLGKVFYANLYWATYEPSLAINRDIVFDLAPHPVDILNYLLDEWPTRVDGFGDSYLHGKENREEMAIVNFEFPDRILAQLYLSWIHHGAKERTIKVICEKGTLTCNALVQKIQLDYDHASVEIQPFPFDLNNLLTPTNRDGSTPNKDGTKDLLGPNNTMRDMQYHFISQIRRRGPQMSSALVGARTVQVLEEITLAMRTRRAPFLGQVRYPTSSELDAAGFKTWVK